MVQRMRMLVIIMDTNWCYLLTASEKGKILCKSRNRTERYQATRRSHVGFCAYMYPKSSKKQSNSSKLEEHPCRKYHQNSYRYLFHLQRYLWLCHNK